MTAQQRFEGSAMHDTVIRSPASTDLQLGNDVKKSKQRSRKLSPKRILILSDHPVLSVGLAELIRTDPELSDVQTVSTFTEAAVHIETCPPAMLLLDIAPPSQLSSGTLAELHERYPALPILVFSTQNEVFYAERALKFGARGYLMEQSGLLIVEAIKTVLAGHVYLSSTMSEEIIESIAGSRRGRTSSIEALSSRETEILRLIGEGRDTEQISQQLQLSANTIAVHRSNIKRKLNLKSAGALAVFAVKWLDQESSSNG